MSELLPCPFCGGLDLTYRQDEAEDSPGHYYAWHVFCQDCHCHGRNNFPIGWCETELAAAEAWNLRGFRRHADAPTPPLLSQEEAFQRAVKAGMWNGLVSKPEDTTL